MGRRGGEAVRLLLPLLLRMAAPENVPFPRSKRPSRHFTNELNVAGESVLVPLGQRRGWEGSPVLVGMLGGGGAGEVDQILRECA